MVTKALRRNLLATTIIAGSLAVSPAFAQGTAPAAPAEEDTIIVTGTLIANPNLTSSSPVTAVGAEELQLRQTNTAEQILREIPGVIPGNGQQVNNGQSSSGSTLNLRGLGSNRNIILLDGSRITPANFNGTVDLNNIPLALVDRVDVLTGGASTTYGADAVSGVVNFITKKDFAGFAAQVSEQISEKGDGNTLRADVTIGANFDDGRGNAVLGIGYIETDAIYQGDRDFSLFTVGSANGRASGASNASIPAAIANIRNAIDPTPGNNGYVQINPAGTVFAPFYNGFNFNPYNIFQTPFRRYNAFAQARYEISDSVEVYSRALFSKNTTSSIVAPSGLFGVDQTINAGNPYLTPALRDQLCAVQATALVGAACTSATTLVLPGYYRRSVELGPRVDTYTTTIFDYQVGARFKITDSVKLDLYGAYGESENVQVRSGYVSNSRVAQSLLAVSTTACTNTANGCVPFNPFGAISPQAGAFIGGITSSITNKATLAQAHAVVNGDLGFTAPWASEPVNFAVGGEYRKYGAERNPDNLAQVPGELGGAGGAILPLSGGYDVYEAFGELIVPIASDRPFFDDLSIEGGIRYSKYSVAAAGNPTFSGTTYKGGINWSPVSALKLRGNYQRAVRAPNIGELFAPVSSGLTSLQVDPCAGTAPVGNANLTAVCIAQGANAGQIGTIPQPNTGQAVGTGGGNPNLKPETADTYSFGAILKPEGLVPNLTLSVDYYHILVRNAVTSPTSKDVIDACFTSNPAAVSAAAAASAACTAISRNRTTGGLSGTVTAANPFTGLPTPLSNLGRLETDGIDFKLAWRHDFGAVKFNYDFNGNWTRSARFQATPTSPNRECVGYYSANCSSQNGALQPEWTWTQRTTLGFQDVDVSLLWRHIGAMSYEPGLPALFSGTITNAAGVSYPLAGQTVNFNKIPAYDYFDLSARFNITKTLQLTLTGYNIFAKAPPLVGAQAGTTGQNSGNTFPSTYDSIGRRFAATVNVRF